MEITYGAHGPRELHVILLDNGRREAASDPILREASLLPEVRRDPLIHDVGGMGFYTTGSKKLAHKCLEIGYSESCPLGIDLSRIIENIVER